MCMNNVVPIRSLKDTVGTCAHCQRSIHVNEQVKTVTVAKEIFDSPISTNIVDAQCTHMFCNRCWRSFDFKSLEIPRTSIMTRDEDDEYITAICEGLREQAAKELQLDPTTLTIDQINNWRIDKEYEEVIRSEIAKEKGIHPASVTDAQIKKWLFE